MAGMALAWAAGAQVTVEIPVATFTGRTNTRPVTIAPTQQPFVWVDTNSVPARTNVVWGQAVTVWPTNGVAEARLVPGNYRATFEGVNTAVLFAAPEGTNRVSLADLVSSGLYTMTNWVGGISGGGSGTFEGWTNVLLGARLLWVDGVSGNDSTAVRQDPTHAWATPTAAATNAVEGDSIVVMAGSYIADSLGTNLVNWVLESGSEIASDYPCFTFTNATASISGSGAVTNTAGGSVLVCENSTVLVDGITLGGRIELIGTNNVVTLRDCVVDGPRDWLLGEAGNTVRFYGAESAHICTNTQPSLIGTLGVR